MEILFKGRCHMITFIGFLLFIGFIGVSSAVVEICGDHVEEFIRGKLKRK